MHALEKESWRTRLFRWGINLYPMYFGTGGRVKFISADWHKVIIGLRLNLWTRNYVGTIFGGSQFSATDPFLMLMAMHILGDDFIVWDKAARIQFKKPAKKKLTMEFLFTPEEIADLRTKTLANGKYEVIKALHWLDEKGEIVSTIEKTLYCATKE